MTSVTCEGAVPHASGDVAAVARVQSISQRLVDCLGVQQHGVVERSHETVHLLATQFNNRTACSLYASQVSVQLRTTWHCPRLLLRARRAAIDRHTRRAHSSKSAVPCCSVLFFSRPRSEGWPHHGRTFSIYPQSPLPFRTLLQRANGTDRRTSYRSIH